MIACMTIGILAIDLGAVATLAFLGTTETASGLYQWYFSTGITGTGKAILTLVAHDNNLGFDISSGVNSLSVWAWTFLLGFSVHEPFATNLSSVDAMIPIGRGQRELWLLKAFGLMFSDRFTDLGKHFWD